MKSIRAAKGDYVTMIFSSFSVRTITKTKAFDYAVFLYGGIGTLLVMGVFGEAPKAVLIFWGLFSSLICLSSLSALAVGLLVECFEASQRRMHFYYVFLNLIPAIAFFHLVNPEAV